MVRNHMHSQKLYSFKDTMLMTALCALGNFNHPYASRCISSWHRRFRNSVYQTPTKSTFSPSITAIGILASFSSDSIIMPTRSSRLRASRRHGLRRLLRSVSPRGTFSYRRYASPTRKSGYRSIRVSNTTRRRKGSSCPRRRRLCTAGPTQTSPRFRGVTTRGSPTYSAPKWNTCGSPTTRNTSTYGKASSSR